MKKVSIIIPNWNGRSLLEKNIPFWIKSMENTKNQIGEIILVDDKSKDDSVNFVKKNYPKIKLVSHKINRGFSATCNTGVRLARYPIICLINTDVIPSENFLEKVLPHFLDKKVFGVSLHEKGYGYATGKFSSGFIIHSPGSEKNVVSNTFWVSGGSGVFRRSEWIKLGGFDEKIFSPFYWEDVDLSYRALKRGFKLLWEPRAHVVHEHESVINRNNFKMWKVNLIKERNYLLFNWKNLTSSNLFKKHRRGLIKRLTTHPGYLKVVIAALFKLGEVQKLRKKERKEEKVSDEAIFGSFE